MKVFLLCLYWRDGIRGVFRFIFFALGLPSQQ